MGFIYVALGGAIGAMGRYALSLIPVKSGFPILTLITNIIGALIIGFIAGAVNNKVSISPNIVLFLKTGLCGRFHDSVLKELSYILEEYVGKDNAIYFNNPGRKRVKAVFNSQLAKEIEIVLLSPRIVHIVPARENYFSILYEASIIIKDCKVYFYDSDISDIRENYDGMYFVSMGMMWRYT